MKPTALCKRLTSAVKYVRQGASFADIGTDHAYLPIYLLSIGRIERAVLADINRGPLLSARENAERAGVIDKVELVLTDGAAELSSHGITDFAIFGMGGELIADIIGRAPFLKDEKIRLILQPMTKAEYLCDYLISEGFSVIGETYTADAGKFYRTVCVEYNKGTPVPENFSKIGLCTTPCEEIAQKIGYLKARRASLLRAVTGKESTGLTAESERFALNLVSGEIQRLKEMEK